MMGYTYIKVGYLAADGEVTPLLEVIECPSYPGITLDEVDYRCNLFRCYILGEEV